MKSLNMLTMKIRCTEVKTGGSMNHWSGGNMNTKRYFWTPFAVERNGQLAWLSIYASYDEQHDLLTVSSDCSSRSYYRRGASLHNSRAECIARLKEQGKVLG